MTVPLMILAVCALLVGLIFGPTKLFEHHLQQTPGLHAPEGEAEHAFDWMTAGVGTLAGVLGLGLAAIIYLKPVPAEKRLAGSRNPLYLASLHKFYVDELYVRVIVWPTRFLALTAEFLDKFLIDTVIIGTISSTPRVFGRYILGRAQNGLIQNYAWWTSLGVGVVLLLLIFLI
jgi:NADH-quinone oxidoreductase subunit L